MTGEEAIRNLSAYGIIAIENVTPEISYFSKEMQAYKITYEFGLNFRHSVKLSCVTKDYDAMLVELWEITRRWSIFAGDMQRKE